MTASPWDSPRSIAAAALNRGEKCTAQYGTFLTVMRFRDVGTWERAAGGIIPALGPSRPGREYVSLSFPANTVGSPVSEMSTDNEYRAYVLDQEDRIVDRHAFPAMDT